MNRIVMFLIFGPWIIAIPVTWVWMLMLGIVHAQILPAVIPAGFGAVFPLALIAVYSICVSLVSKALAS